MRRLFSSRQRFLLAMRAGGKCESCGVKLTKETYHADHVRPWSKGGETLTTNGAALCAKCNLSKGVQIMGMKKTRDWQETAERQSMQCYRDGQRNFVINAAPGAGKTYAAAMIAQSLIEADMIDRVIVIAPRKKIVTQWTNLFRKVAKREMMKMTGNVFKAFNPETMQEDIAATWSGIKGMADALQIICESQRVLVIADEVHHAALGAVWGDGTTHALASAKHVLALTGTPTRGDGREPIWLDDAHKMQATNYLNVPYSEAIGRKWCVPATLHRHGGVVNILMDNQIIESRETGTIIPPTITMTAQMKNKLRFDRVIKQPLYEADGVTPQLPSYHSTMIDWADDKLEELRSREYGDFGLPNAGGLVIAPSIEMAEYFKAILEMKHPDDSVAIVHSKMGGSATEMIIDAFSRSDNKWIVSVNMISEGVDIPRLRVMVYLPSGGTELFFRQAVGRVIRKDDKTGDPDLDNSRAYIVMPNVSEELVRSPSFVEFARSLEEDMGETEPPPPPKCPQCGTEGERPRAGSPCKTCGYEPEKKEPEPWECSSWSKEGCGAINVGGMTCHSCGLPKSEPLSFAGAIGERKGVISRQLDVDEHEVLSAEEVAPELMAAAKKDPRYLQLLQVMPIENMAVVEGLFKEVRQQKEARQ